MKRYLWDGRYGWSKIKEFSGPKILNWLRWWKVMWLVSWRVQPAILGNCNLNIMKLVSRCWVNGRRTTGRGQWRSDRGDLGMCIPIVRMNAPFLQQCSSTALTQFSFHRPVGNYLTRMRTPLQIVFHCMIGPWKLLSCARALMFFYILLSSPKNIQYHKIKPSLFSFTNCMPNHLKFPFRFAMRWR